MTSKQILYNNDDNNNYILNADDLIAKKNYDDLIAKNFIDL